MSFPDPFSSRFEVFGREHRHSVEAINQRAFEELKGLLDTGSGGDGRVILLRAPRAGYGKTSLLQRLSSEFAESHQFVRINLTGGRTTDAAHVLEYVLQALCQVLPNSTTLTRLDLLARGILALGLEPLVASGEVPCQDPEGALAALRENPAETLDFHHDRAVTAHWTKSNFEILGPRLAAELARESGASLREASYWVELLFRFATTPPDNVERARLLFETIFRNDLHSQSASAAEERLLGLLALCGTVTSPVLVVDDTEGLSTAPPDALALSSFLANISQSCPGTAVLLSVNDDIWESAFLPLLPGGLADRLLEHNVSLDALSRKGAEALISARAGNRASEVIAGIDWVSCADSLYSRHVLKLASEAWKELEHREPEPSPGELQAKSTTAEKSKPLGASEASQIADALADLPDFKGLYLEQGSKEMEAEPQSEPDVPASGDSGADSEHITEPVLTREPEGADPGESPFAPKPGPEQESPPELESARPVTAPSAEQPERVAEEPASLTAVDDRIEKGAENPPKAEVAGALAPGFVSFPDAGDAFSPTQAGDTGPGVGEEDQQPPEEDATIPEAEERILPPASQPVSPFVAVSPTADRSDTPSPAVFEDCQPTIGPVEAGEGEEGDAPSYPGPTPAEPIRLFSPGEPSGTASAPEESSAGVPPIDSDPTGGEIEFARLKPLSEEPPASPSSPLIDQDQEPPSAPATADPEPQIAASQESPFTPVYPVASPADEESVFASISPREGADRAEIAPPETPFSPVNLQASAPFTSPFAADNPPNHPSPAEAAPRQEAHGATPQTSSPGEASPAPSSWWPGDGAVVAPSENSSPFAAVGVAPTGYAPREQPDSVPAPTAPGGSQPTDKEEVDKLLRQLRERQDQR
jgi:hypothetical protein